jgi:hypothetical protein
MGRIMSTPEFDGTITDIQDRKCAESLLSTEKRTLEMIAGGASQSEPPFKVTQLVVLALFVVLAIVGAIRFRNEQLRAA